MTDDFELLKKWIWIPERCDSFHANYYVVGKLELNDSHFLSDFSSLGSYTRFAVFIQNYEYLHTFFTLFVLLIIIFHYCCYMIIFFLQAYHGHVQALQVLLESFIDIDIKDADGKSSSLSTRINLTQISAVHCSWP